MWSLKTRKYAKYYLLLEKCIKYYNDYQNKLNYKYIIKLKNKIVDKDDKIDQLMKQSDELFLKIDEQNLKIDKQNLKISD